MRRSTRIERSLAVWALLLAPGCDEAEPPAKKAPRSQAAPEPHRSTERAPLESSVSRQPSPQERASRLVFSAGRLGQLRDQALVVHEVASWTVAARIELGEAAAVGAHPDGSLIAVGRRKDLSHVVRVLPPRATEPITFTGRLNLPVSGLAHLIAPRADRIYTARGALLTGHALKDGKVRADENVELGPDGTASVAALAGGSVVFESGGALVHAQPGGEKTRYEMPGDARLRHVAAGRGPRSVWLAAKDRVFLASLAGGDAIEPAATFTAGGDVFHLDASGDLAAALVVKQEGGRESWSLVALHASRGELWRASIPTPRTSQLEDLFVAASPTHIAVGGSESFQVWDVRRGARLDRAE